MERQISPRADGSAEPGFWGKLLWAIALLGLFAWQAWLSLGLFGSDRPCQRLLDAEPIVSGAHPLHLYFGYLGARSFYERACLCCYDPAFQAGYPKTPVFDSGSRPAELFLSVAGGGYQPAAYKVGLALCCCLAPLFLVLAARAIGLGRFWAATAAAVGMLIWWGVPCRQALEAGDLDLLMAALAIVAFVALLIRFDRRPDFRGWVGLSLTGWLGCFMQPFLFAFTVPLHLVYYLSVGARHRLNWHLGLMTSLAIGLAANSFWLGDWVTSWWIRTPLQFAGSPLAHRTFRTIWDAPPWGGSTDRALGLVIVGLASLGVAILNQTNQRAAARLLGLGTAGFLVLAILGLTWRPLGHLGTAQLVLPALWFGILPAVYALAWLYQRTGACMGRPWCGVLAVSGVLFAIAACGPEIVLSLASRCVRAQPLEMGLGRDREALMDTIRARTTSAGRILIEDRPSRREAPRWTALLPQLTQRSYLGGLDPEGWIEHSFARLVDGTLAGRPLHELSDADLEQFARRYAVGWMLCWSPDAVARFREWKGAREIGSVQDEGQGFLFELKPPTYVLRGRADLLYVNRQRLALANVVPEDGVVVLSQHYQAGIQVSPPRVQIEPDKLDADPDDPIPFIRLRVPGPTALITLTWDEK